MRALTWQGAGKVSVETVPDPQISEPTDAIVRMTSTAVCGSDLHLYDVLGMYLAPGDIIGHEPMGIVEEVGPEVTHIAPGDRVVIPLNISCGHCWMCTRGQFAQCETTQVTEQGKGARLFGCTQLYGAVPGAQAELLCVPQAQLGPIKVPHEHPDERFLFLSDVLTTAWQAVKDADIGAGSTCAVIGLGPIGQMGTRVAKHLGAERVIGVDSVPERLSIDTPVFRHAANRTGRDVRPVPPVASPHRNARAIVRCGEHPRREVHVGALHHAASWDTRCCRARTARSRRSRCGSRSARSGRRSTTATSSRRGPTSTPSAADGATPLRASPSAPVRSPQVRPSRRPRNDGPPNAEQHG